MIISNVVISSGVYKVAFFPPWGIELFGKKIKWGRREGKMEGNGRREKGQEGKEGKGKREGKREVKVKRIGTEGEVKRVQVEKWEGGDEKRVSGNFIHPCIS